MKVNFTGQTHAYSNQQKKYKNAVKTTAGWFAFGLGFDYFCKKCVVFKKSPVKNSLFINGILALGAGICTFLKNDKN